LKLLCAGEKRCALLFFFFFFFFVCADAETKKKKKDSTVEFLLLGRERDKMGNQLSTQVDAIFRTDNVSAFANLLTSQMATIDAPIDELDNTMLHLAVQHSKK
jgi:hypothetical protein